VAVAMLRSDTAEVKDPCIRPRAEARGAIKPNYKETAYRSYKFTGKRACRVWNSARKRGKK